MLRISSLILLFSFINGVAKNYDNVNSCVYYKPSSALDYVVVSLKTRLDMDVREKCQCKIYLDKLSIGTKPVLDGFSELNSDVNIIDISLRGKLQMQGKSRNFNIKASRLSQLSNITFENFNNNELSRLFYSDISNELNQLISTCTFPG